MATGSNDKMIKILVAPNFDEIDCDNVEEIQKEIREMELKGHQAIVRTVCFNPMNPTVLLSGGLMENDVKVWDAETGQNVANLKGHQGNVNSIKASSDGSFAVSVGTDKKIKIWDIRCKSCVDSMDGDQFSEMNEVCLTMSHPLEATDQQTQKVQQLQISGFASIGHLDGSLSIWDLSTRSCLAHEKLHQADQGCLLLVRRSVCCKCWF